MNYIFRKEIGMIGDCLGRLVLVVEPGVPCRSFESLPSALFKLDSVLCVTFSFLSWYWSESELLIVMLFIYYKQDILFQSCWEIFKLFCFLYTHSFLYSFIFNICLFKSMSILFGPVYLCKFHFFLQQCLLSHFSTLSLTAFYLDHSFLDSGSLLK